MDSQVTIYVIFWEGPFPWDKRKGKVKPQHVLYQIYGQHPVYGSNILLYIGMAQDVEKRLAQHEAWICDECDNVSVRVGSLGQFKGWQEWEKPGSYPKAATKIVKQIEALLIYAHQPAYNTANKSSAKEISKNIRIFNSGHYGQLLPEVSYKYYFGEA
jgi:hypothetical protein